MKFFLGLILLAFVLQSGLLAKPGERFPKIPFKHKSTRLTKPQFLEILIARLKADTSLYLWIDGHATKQEGDTTASDVLAYDRANTVRQYLVEKGVSTNQIHARGWGFRKQPARSVTFTVALQSEL